MRRVAGAWVSLAPPNSNLSKPAEVSRSSNVDMHPNFETPLDKSDASLIRSQTVDPVHVDQSLAADSNIQHHDASPIEETLSPSSSSSEVYESDFESEAEPEVPAVSLAVTTQIEVTKAAPFHAMPKSPLTSRSNTIDAPIARSNFKSDEVISSEAIQHLVLFDMTNSAHDSQARAFQISKTLSFFFRLIVLLYFFSKSKSK